MTKSPNKVSSENYSQNWSIPNFEQLSAEERKAHRTSGPQTREIQGAARNPLFSTKTAEARNRQAALEAYTDSRSQSVVARIAQIEVEGLRRRENVAVDEEALQNYAYQDNDSSFQEANFARLNRYISANHNDIYVKALRNKASSLVGENGKNIMPRLFSQSGGSAGVLSGQSNSYLGGIRGNAKQISASYPSYQSFTTNDGDAVVSKRVAGNPRGVGGTSFVSAQQARYQQAQQVTVSESAYTLTNQAQSQAAILALASQQRAQMIADRQRAAAMSASEEEENDKILLNNSNTFIVSNSPYATAEYETSERLYEEEQTASKDKGEETYGPRTVISVHERATGYLPEELVEMDYVYDDDEIEAPSFSTEEISVSEAEQDEYVKVAESGATEENDATVETDVDFDVEADIAEQDFSEAEFIVEPDAQALVEQTESVAQVETELIESKSETNAEPEVAVSGAEQERVAVPVAEASPRVVVKTSSKSTTKTAPANKAVTRRIGAEVQAEATQPQRRLRRRAEAEVEATPARMVRRRQSV